VRQLPPEALAFACAAVDRVRKSNADQETEGRLDRVVKANSGPRNMRLIVSKDSPEQAIGKGTSDRDKLHRLAHHEQHHQASICVDGNVAR
jgi:hypothetical protein